MPTCFILQAHHQPELFTRLVHRLAVPGASIIAHIDAKTDPTPFLIPPQLSFLTPRQRVNWGGWSQSVVMQRLLRTALERHPEAEHIVFLSGQDYPCRPVKEFIAMLESQPRKTWMNFYAMAPGTQFFDVLLHARNDDLRAYPGLGPMLDLWDRATWRLRRRYRRSLPPGVQLYRGSTSWCVSREAARAMLQLLDSPAGRTLCRFLSRTHVSDEIWGATALLNTPERVHAAAWDTDGQAVPGERFGENKVYHHYIDWSPQRENPAVLTLADLPAIVRSQKWFIRKVSLPQSGHLLDELDLRARQEG